MRSLSPPPADAPAAEIDGRTGGAPPSADLPPTGGGREPATQNRERPRVRPRLGRRLLIALLLAGVFPVGIGGYISWRDQERVLRTEALAHAQHVAQLLAGRVKLFVRSIRQDVAVLADTPELRAAILDGNWTVAQRVLDITARHHPDLRVTVLADESGRVRAATGVAAGSTGMEVSARPHIALARKHQRLVVSAAFRSPIDQRPVIGLAAPILKGSQIIAILGAAVDLNLIAAEIQQGRLGAEGFAVVQTAEGRILVNRDPTRVLQLAPEVNRASVLTRRGPTGALETTRPDGTRDFTGFATVPDLHWVVLAHIPKDQALASLTSMRKRTLTLLGWLLALVGVSAVAYGRALTRPMNELAAAARALGAGDLGRRIPTRGDDEVAEVARAFNEMADRRQQAEAALQVSLARRDALTQLSAAIAAGTDRADITRQVVAATARLLGAPYAVLWTPDPQGARLIPAAEFVDPPLGPLPPQPAIAANASLADALSSGRDLLAVPDVRGHPGWANQTWPGLQVLGSYLGLRLETDGGPAGILNALDRPGRTFTSEEIELLCSLGTHAALALEKAALLEEAERAAAQAEALVEVGRLITETVELDTVLARVVEKTTELLDAAACGVTLIEQAEGEMVFRFWQAHGLPAVYRQGHTLRLGEGVLGRAIQERRPVWSSDILSDPAIPLSDEARQRILTHGVPRAILAAPLARGIAAIGGLVVYRPAGAAYSPAEVQALTALASQAAVAIENARLFQTTKRAADEIAAIHEAGQAITESLDPHATLSRIAESARRLAGADRSFVWLVDPTDGSLEAGIALGPGAEAFLGTRLPADSPATAARAVREGRPTMAPNACDLASADPGLSARFGNAALLAVPLRFQETILGVLVCGYNQPRAFAVGEVNRLAALAQQAAIAIQNARLFDAQREAAAQAERQRARAEALAAVGQAVSASLDLDAVLGLVVERAAGATGADAVAVLQRDPTTGELRFRRAYGLSRDVDREVLPAGRCIAGAALAAGQPVWTEDLRTDPRFAAAGHVLPLVAQEGVRAVLSVPIRGHQDAYGVLSLYRRTVHTFTEEEIDFAVRIADQAAVAIENARLFQEEQERRRQVEAVRAVTEEITRELDLAALLQLIAQRAADLSNTTSSVIYVWDEEAQILVPRAWHGFTEWIRDLRLRLGEGLAGAAAQRRERMQVNDYRTSPYAHPLVLKHTDMTAALAEPLLHHDRLVGVILITNQGSGRSFSEQDYTILALFAAQAAIAIENARLYAEVRGSSEELERKVAERTRELEAANRAKSEFLANMSHELRTPLNAIIGFSEMLKMQSFGPLSPKQQKYVHNIHTGGVHLLNLVNDVLDLARVEAGRLELRCERTPLAPAIAEALDGVRPQAEQKGLTLVSEAEPDLPAIQADPVRLRQILVNLLSNAVKFTPDGGRVTVRAIRPPSDAPDSKTDCVAITVQDTGIGIAPDELGRLFRKFEQLESGPSKGHQGTGLGLALTKHLVELHGGTIAVHSAGRGRGTTFTLRLPAGPQRERPEVLVVDDDPLVREMLTASARDWGWEAAAAATLAEARACVNQALPDLVILDSSLPDGSGLDFAHELRRVLARRVPILMYTGLGAVEGEAALKLGADDYLVKPAPLELLHRKASKLLARAGWPGSAEQTGAENGDDPTRPADPTCAAREER